MGYICGLSVFPLFGLLDGVKMSDVFISSFPPFDYSYFNRCYFVLSLSLRVSRDLSISIAVSFGSKLICVIYMFLSMIYQDIQQLLNGAVPTSTSRSEQMKPRKRYSH